MCTPKQVSFSPSSTLILTSELPKSQKSKLWNSREEIAASKLRWAKTVKQVQSMDMSSANEVDASQFMGLERYLSKDIQKQSDQNRHCYTQSIIHAQHQYSSPDELADFARSKTKDAVARSHAVGIFYLNRHFQQEQPKCKSKFQETKDGSSHIRNRKYKRHSSDPTGRKADDCYEFTGFKKSDQRKSSAARCA